MLTSSARLLPIFVVYLLLAHSTLAETYYVRSSGSDSNNGLSKDFAFATLTKAIQTAAAQDTVYVGAGTYSETASKTYPAASFATLDLVGDIKGIHTGDAGTILVEVPSNKWGIIVRNARHLSVSDMHFRADVSSNPSYGVYANGITDYVAYNNCTFEELRYAAYTIDSNTYSIGQCKFVSNYIAMYTNRTSTCKAENNAFVACTYGQYLVDIDDALTRNSSYTTSTNPDGSFAANYPIRGWRCGLTVSNCSMENSTYGVYGVDLQSCSVANTKVANAIGGGVYVTGSNLSAEDLQLVGTGNRRGWGLNMSDVNGKDVDLANIETSGFYGGILARGSGYQFKGVTSNDNYIGLYIHADTPKCDVEASSLTLQSNHFGIYSSHREGSEGEISVRNAKLVGGTYGFYAARSSIQLTDCTFADSLRGAWITYAKNATVQRCSFSNTPMDETTNYGLYIHSSASEVSNCKFVGLDYGLYFNNFDGGTPKLSDLDFSDSRRINLYFIGGSLELDAGSNVAIRGGQYGIYTRNANCTLNGPTVPTGCERPIYHREGSLDVRNMDIGEGLYGIYAYKASPLRLENINIKGMQSHGFYLHSATDASLVNCTSASNGGYGFYLYKPGTANLSKVDALANTTYNFYCNMDGATEADFSISDSHFDGSTYGYRSVGVPFTPKTASNIKVTNCNHGLRVENAPLVLSPGMNIELTGNTYAAMSYYSSMEVDRVVLAGNLRGIYCYESTLNIANTKIDAVDYGILAYSGATVSDCEITNARYGVYFSPRNNGSTDLTISDTSFDSNSSIGIYVYSLPDKIAEVSIADARLTNGGRGLYTYNSNLSAKSTTISGMTSHGIYQSGGNAVHEDLVIDNVNSWGVLSYGQSTVLDRAKIKSRYGVYLRANNGKVMNSVVSDSVYGVYANNSSGNVEILQSTIANIGSYGVVNQDGNLSLRNSIVDAKVYALWNRSASGHVEHDHNLIKADRLSYVGEDPGINEIEKEPIFLDPTNGDYHLAAGSPAINSGADLTGILSVDIEGNERNSFRAFEMGAFEFMENAGSLRVLEWDEKAK